MGQTCTLRLARWLDLELPNTEKAGLLKADGGAYGEGQVLDEYEDDPRICQETYYQRVRGDDGYWPPNQLREIPGMGLTREKTIVWATVVIDSLESIDAVNCTFGVRMKMFLVFKADLENTPVWNKFHKDADKRGRWETILEKAREMGGPYKLEDDEYELFSDELIYPQSLEIRNKITAERECEPDFQILDPFEGEVWVKFFDGLYTCREVQELHIFPFDVQDLHLDLFMTSKVDQDRFDLKVHTVEFSKSALELMEWSVYPPDSDRKGTHGTSIRLVVVRNSGYFLQSVVFPSLLFTIICLMAFVIPCAYEDGEPNDSRGDGAADRLSVTLTMMLTSVAFKFLISNELPKISYFTMLDSFLNQHFTFIFILSMHFAIGPYYVKDKSEDWLVMYGLSAVFFLITLWWLFKAYILVKSRDHLLPEKVAMPKGDAISWRWQSVPHIEKIEEGNGPPMRGWKRRSTIVDRDGNLRSIHSADRSSELLPTSITEAVKQDQVIELANIKDRETTDADTANEDLLEQPSSASQGKSTTPAEIIRITGDENSRYNEEIEKPLKEYDYDSKQMIMEDQVVEVPASVPKAEKLENVEVSAETKEASPSVKEEDSEGFR